MPQLRSFAGPDQLAHLRIDFGRVTPFGGVAFMIGWAAVAIAALRR